MYYCVLVCDEDDDERMICFLVHLVRPTLDVIQKARSNMENHLQDTNMINKRLTNGTQSLRPQRKNGLD